MILTLNKKGQNGKVLLAVTIFLFIFGFLSILGHYMTSSYIQAFNETGLYTPEMQKAGDGFLKTHALFDYVIVLIMITLVIGIGITSYKLATAPIFFILMFVSGIFYGFISYIFNYLFQEIVAQPIFAATLIYFPRTILICKNLHWVMVLEIIVGALALYGKKEKGQGQYLS